MYLKACPCNAITSVYKCFDSASQFIGFFYYLNIKAPGGYSKEKVSTEKRQTIFYIQLIFFSLSTMFNVDLKMH